MASIYDLKPGFQSLLRPIASRLAALGLTPNVVTLSALFGSLAAGAVLTRASGTPSLLLLLPVWSFFRMALNAIDGMMARERRMTSRLGGALNEMGDVLSDIALYLPLAVVHPPSRWPVVGFCFGAVLTEFAGLLGPALGSDRRYEGPMGKSDRAFLAGALGLATWFVPATYHIWPWAFACGTLLAAATCVNRISKAITAPASSP